MRILFAISFLITFGWQPAHAAELTADQLAGLYPPDEHCLFVPPPNWPGLFPIKRSEKPQLIADRILAYHSVGLLQSETSAIVDVLQPDVGLTLADLDRGGDKLRETLSSLFDQYAAIWRSTMPRNNDYAQSVDLAPLAPLQLACSRRAVMVLHDHRDRGVTATVISLITGNRLAAATFR